jgi:hypothetical protein
VKSTEEVLAAVQLVLREDPRVRWALSAQALSM